METRASCHVQSVTSWDKVVKTLRLAMEEERSVNAPIADVESIGTDERPGGRGAERRLD